MIEFIVLVLPVLVAAVSLCHTISHHLAAPKEAGPKEAFMKQLPELLAALGKLAAHADLEAARVTDKITAAAWTRRASVYRAAQLELLEEEVCKN